MHSIVLGWYATVEVEPQLEMVKALMSARPEIKSLFSFIVMTNKSG